MCVYASLCVCLCIKTYGAFHASLLLIFCCIRPLYNPGRGEGRQMKIEKRGKEAKGWVKIKHSNNMRQKPCTN